MIKRPEDPKLPLVCLRHWDKEMYEVFDPEVGAIIVDPRAEKRLGYLAPIIIVGDSDERATKGKTYIEIEGRDPGEATRKKNQKPVLTRSLRYASLRDYHFICYGTNPDDPAVLAFLENHGLSRPIKAPSTEDLDALALSALVDAVAQAKQIFITSCKKAYPQYSQGLDAAKTWDIVWDRVIKRGQEKAGAERATKRNLVDDAQLTISSDEDMVSLLDSCCEELIKAKA